MFPLKPLGGIYNEDFVIGNHSNATNSSCLEPDYVVWVYTVFRECIYSPKEEIGFTLGLVSVLCWICASIPQLFENWKKGKVDESLSIWFLLLWLLGDSSNLVGCILTKQFPIQLYTAVYYVTMDIIIILQFGYYKRKHIRSAAGRRGIINDVLATSPIKRNEHILFCMGFGFFFYFATFNSRTQNIDQIYASENRIGRTLLSQPLGQSFPYWNVKTVTGYVIGCVSSVLYLGSRLPQLRLNYQRGETEGVSMMMFFLAVCGNSLYGTSILMQDPDPGKTWGEFIVFHLPWLIGSIGTLMLDFTILGQIIYYSDKCKNRRKVPAIMVSESDALQDEDNNPLIV